MYEWDERKRQSNLNKHGFDFSQAHLVYENIRKVTLSTSRRGEARLQDIALVEVHGFVVALTYVLRNDRVRCISLRVASRKERKLYAEQS